MFHIWRTASSRSFDWCAARRRRLQAAGASGAGRRAGRLLRAARPSGRACDILHHSMLALEPSMALASFSLVAYSCMVLLWILTDKRFHSNLAIAPTCDTVSTYHITDNARDPQRGLSRATYLLKVSRRLAVPNEKES